jgi:hypothetical protein
VPGEVELGALFFPKGLGMHESAQLERPADQSVLMERQSRWDKRE